MAGGIERLPMPRDLRCEYQERPLGIDEPRPRLSWKLEDAGRGTRQTAYRILVASSPEVLARDRGDIWDSGRVRSDRSVHVEYAGRRLESRRRYWWEVRTWDAAGRPSAWSEPSWWEMGLLSRGDWTAQWIGLRDQAVPLPCTFLRKTFRLNGKAKRARLYATALGVYEVYLNGRRIGDHRFAPGWTDYRWRVMYQTFDVTDALVEGENAAGAILGEGWYCGALTWNLKRNCFGDPPPRLLFQLEVETGGGKTMRVVSDGSWKATNNGPVRSSEIYAGETYDARLEMPGWDRPGFGDGDWKPVEVFADPGIEMNAQADPPIRATQELKPVAMTQPVRGTYIFDMGQNMVGVCRLRLPGNVPPGTAITLRHGEELQPDGTLYVENLRKARATDTYIAGGSGRPETWTPRFTYHGFRYVELTGYPGTPVTDTVTGLVIHTDARPVASFESSSPIVNRLWRNIEWGLRGNMFSVLTDCPQRDERLGWMGDAQVFCRTACSIMDMASMLTKFVRDMRDAQAPSGAFRDVAPYIPGGLLHDTGAPCWADAGVVVPWTVYE
ncbi:MAG: family 78 glycoside hydrolase catalytic domain, partial [Planctomycetota bacterium]|nr:family 78 glycoside hydrolase catalytic domain [Planctomycetota bacterium]